MKTVVDHPLEGKTGGDHRAAPGLKKITGPWVLAPAGGGGGAVTSGPEDLSIFRACLEMTGPDTRD